MVVLLIHPIHMHKCMNVLNYYIYKVFTDAVMILILLLYNHNVLMNLLFYSFLNCCRYLFLFFIVFNAF